MIRSARQKAIILGGAVCAATVVTLAARLAFAQAPVPAEMPTRPKGNGVMHFETKLGSFKLLGSDGEDVSGHLEMTCKGTIVVSGIDALPKTTGTLKLEYSYKPLKKYAFHGAGTLVLEGTWRNVQWFGTDLMANFNGRGKLRLVGEFDKDLNTGFYWTTDPSKKAFWSANNVSEHVIPPFQEEAPPTIKEVPITDPGPVGK